MTFSCNATGEPAPTIWWTKDVSIISTSGNPRVSFGADSKTLTITNVNRADSGQYRCVANSSAGEDISNAATLNVQCKQCFIFLSPVCYFHFEAAEDVLNAQY